MYNTLMGRLPLHAEKTRRMHRKTVIIIFVKCFLDEIEKNVYVYHFCSPEILKKAYPPCLKKNIVDAYFSYTASITR